MADGDYDHAEIEKLRVWRHDVVSPELAAARAQLKAHEKRLGEIEPRVEAMAHADEIADAVTEHMQKARRGLLTTGEKLGGLAVGLAAVVSVVLQLLH